MKKFLLVCCLFISFTAFSQNTVYWDVFATADCSLEPFEMGQVRQNFIKVKQIGNRFYFGESNYYDVSNRYEKHDGFSTVVIWNFVDKYNQKGLFIYQHNQDADWSTRHALYIFYENNDRGKMYLSNDPHE